MVWRSNKNRHDCMKLFFRDSFIVFDTETTGLHPEKGDRIIQLFALKLHPVNGQLQIIDKLSLYIKPPFPVSEKITELTGISNELLKDKPKENEVFEKIFVFFGNTPVLAAYNTPFDVGMMTAMYQRHNQFFLPEISADVLEMVRDFVSVEQVENFKQESIARLYGVDKDLTFHDAGNDVIATSRILKCMYHEYMTKPEINGWKKPWMGPIYFNDHKRIHKGVYVYLSKDKRLAYNQYYRGWVMKGTENVGQLYDMEYVQEEVINRLGLDSVEDLQKLTKKKLEAIQGKAV